MNPRRRKWLIWLGVVSAIAGLVALIFMDASPPNVSDLTRPPPKVAPGENALPKLLEAVEQIVWDTDEYEMWWQPDEQPDSLYLRKVLADNDKALRTFDEALRRRELQFAPSQLDYEDQSVLSSLRQLGLMKVAEAAVRFDDGEDGEALSDLAASAVAGQRIASGGGTLTYWAIGARIEGQALLHLRKRVPDSSLTAAELAAVQRELAVAGDDGAALAEAIRREAGMLDGRLGEADRDPEAFGDVIWGVGVPRPNLAKDLLIRPNRTRRDLADLAREYMAAARRPAGEFHLSERFGAYSKDRAYMLILSSNVGGHIATFYKLSSYQGCIQWKFRITTELALTRALIALRCHWLDHGTLPERLEELVPAYLPAVPVDDFDGKALRYSREKKRLWSVGEDLIDEGGAAKPDDPKMKRLEPTILLDWKR